MLLNVASAAGRGGHTMNGVLISIQPKWCKLIASGKKTLEVRKTRPKLETPFKVYIYCTQGHGKNTFNCPVSFETIRDDYIETDSMDCINSEIGNCKVIGEFICDEIRDARECFIGPSCLTTEEWLKYTDGYEKPVWCWHISDLKIYEKPKELCEFYIWKKCNSCKATGYESSACVYDEDCKVPAIITRPPQSWCYVEEVLADG
jgi:predicted transcriptional regulator